MVHGLASLCAGSGCHGRGILCVGDFKRDVEGLWTKSGLSFYVGVAMQVGMSRIHGGHRVRGVWQLKQKLG
jgi:hypothetical protein